MLKSYKNKLPIILIAVIVYEIIFPILGLTGLPRPLLILTRYAIYMMALCYVIDIDHKIFKSKPVILYTLWTIYVVIRNIILGYGVWSSHFQMMAAFVPSFVVYISSLHCFKKNEKATINVIIYSLYIFLLYGLAVGGVGSTDIAADERMGGELVNANALGIRAAIAVFFLTIKHLKGYSTFTNYIIFVSLSVLFVLMSGSRTAFVIAFLTLAIFIFKSNKHNQIIKKTILLIIGFFILSYILDNTLIGERILSSTEQAEKQHLETGTLWDIFGDRGYQYYTSIPFIKDNLLLGIGMGKYIEIVPFAVTVLHSEYLIQLLECGLIAFILYFYMYYEITKRLIIKVMNNNTCYDINIIKLALLFMFAMLFTCFVTRVCYYGMYSCCLAYLTYVSLNKN